MFVATSSKALRHHGGASNSVIAPFYFLRSSLADGHALPQRWLSRREVSGSGVVHPKTIAPFQPLIHTTYCTTTYTLLPPPISTPTSISHTQCLPRLLPPPPAASRSTLSSSRSRPLSPRSSLVSLSTLVSPSPVPSAAPSPTVASPPSMCKNSPHWSQRPAQCAPQTQSGASR